VIQAHKLVKQFGELTAVKDVSFQVDKGEIFAFLGPNGAGKTTTIKMLTTLLTPTSGKIELDGLDPTLHQNEARQRFGIVFQDPSLDSEQTAYENMELHAVLYKVPRKVRAERIESLLRLFELWERRDDFVKTFSGGMKRRLEIARGFLHTPKILFLDEPTLGLDPQTRNQLWTHVKRLNETEGVTVFLTTHYMDEAERVAHRIAIIDHGSIVAQGTPQALKQQTNSASLEQAFLALTGTSIRDDAATSADQMRQVARIWRR
jgi:ABC-2 type transport system ATP-binding protein